MTEPSVSRLKPLPVGFQTKARSSISKTVERIDSLVPSAAVNSSNLVKVTTDDAIALIDLVKTTIDDYDLDPFDWKAMRGAIEYYSKIAAPEIDRGNCWLLAETGRTIRRVRPGGLFQTPPTPNSRLRFIYAEGQRRYFESPSAYARQFLEMMQKPRWA